MKIASFNLCKQIYVTTKHTHTHIHALRLRTAGLLLHFNYFQQDTSVSHILLTPLWRLKAIPVNVIIPFKNEYLV